MKTYNALYYLLFVLLIMGAFASMAQNTYGLKILGGVAIAFGLTFLYQFVRDLKTGGNASSPGAPGNASKGRTTTTIEILSLALLSFIFALRLFHIYLPFIEWLLVITSVLLIIIYSRKSFSIFQKYHSFPLLSFHLALILFLAALAASPFIPLLSEWIGKIAFLLAIIFIVAAFVIKGVKADEEKLSAFKIVFSFPDRSVLLFSLFFCISLYLVLTRTNVLPELYSDEYPQSYFELVRQAESGKEKPVNGHYKHQLFLEMYQRFLESERR